MRPTQAHMLKMTALAESAAENEDFADLSGYEKMLRVLARHKKDLKLIQSNERKAAYLLTYLLRIKQLTDGEDMPDQSRARLYKAIGLLDAENNPQRALEHLTRANQLNPNCGVKTLIKRLQKQTALS